MPKMRYVPNLSHSILMDSSFWFHAINLGWSNIYIEGSQVIANSADPDEMLQLQMSRLQRVH